MRFSRVESGSAAPGLNTLTSVKPMQMDTTVVAKNKNSVRPPIRLNLEISPKLDTPMINEANTSGMAIILSPLMKIVPMGLM